MKYLAVVLSIVRLTSVVAALSVSSFADESVLSQVYGVGALKQVVQDKDLRERLGIDDKQLADIRKNLMENTLFIGDREKIQSVAKQYLYKTLTGDQVELLRIELVKREFRTPLSVFRESFLVEIGLDSENAIEIEEAIAERYGLIFKKLDALRTEAITEAFPPDLQEKIWKLIGKGFIIEENGVNWKDIVVVPAITNRYQVAVVQSTPLPKSISLSQEQHQQMDELGREAFSRSAKGVELREDEISSKLDAILSEAQRFAIVQSMQQQVIREDFLMLLSPEVLKRIGLKEEALVEVRSELIESKKRIGDIEAIELAQKFKETMTKLPVPARKVVADLLKGVWNLN